MTNHVNFQEILDALPTAAEMQETREALERVVVTLERIVPSANGEG